MKLLRTLWRLLRRRTTRPTGDSVRKAELLGDISPETRRKLLQSHLAQTNQRQHPKQ